jgi:NDP-sugar pyrophosphorylase family protein
VPGASHDLTAILLCGGKGERLRPFTESLPKPLVPLNGHPLLYYLMEYLSEAGISRFIVCVGYRAEAIEEFVREQCRSEWDVICVNSGDASMTDRLLDARRHFDGPALVCYGDTLANIDLAALVGENCGTGALATLTVYPLHSPFGVVHFDGAKRVTTFAEKPRLPHWINIGYMLCRPAAFEYLRPGSDMVAFLSALAEAGVLTAYQHTGKHLTVNTEKERAKAEVEMVEFLTLLDGQRI